MKTHLHPIHRAAQLTLAALAVAAAGSVSAQTVIPPSLMAPPSAYNTSSTGMVLRAHQIFAARSPGDQNSIANVLKELAGGFGPNRATNGPLPGGFWSELYLNHTTDWPLGPADGDWVLPSGLWALPFPGVNANTAETGGFSTFAYDIITYLNLPAGINTLAVGSGDSFRLTIGVGDNPVSFAAVQAGQFNGSRNFEVTGFDIDVQSAGVYPVRIIYGQGGGINGLQFFSTNAGTRYLINDPTGGGMQLTSYQPTLPLVTPSLAYVSQLLPVPGDPGASPMPTVQVHLTDGTTTTVTNVSTLTFDGVPVSPTITKTGAVTYVTYAVPSLLPNLSVHTNQVVAQDSAGNVLSNQWSFTVGTGLVIPASYAYPAGSGNATMPGFAGRVHQTRAAGDGSPSVLYGNAQISGLLIDGATGLPFVNTVVTNGNPIVGAGWTGTQPADAGGGPGDARTFTATNVVNYSIADGSGAVLDAGNFNSANGYPDALFPGLPGGIDNAFTTYDNSGEIAVELIAFVELPAGLQQIGVNCNDAFQLAISRNDARDLFRQELIKNEGNRDPVDTLSTVFVETNGVYSFRVIYRVYRDTLANTLEWFSADPDNPTTRVLLNDTVAGAKKAYRAVTVPTRPYVKSVSPAKDATGVSPVAPISVVLVNLGTTTPVLKVNSATVAYTAVTNGNEVTLTYTPTALSGTVNCEIAYGGLVGQWSYVVRSGRQALWITSGSTATGGDVPLLNRLASKYGLDVTIVPQSYTLANPTDMSIASNKTLIVVSSLVGSGNTAAWLRNYMSNNIPIPVLFWEYGNTDELGFTESGAGGAQGGTQVFITGAPAYLTAGFTNDQVVTVHSAAGGFHNSGTAAPGTIIAAIEGSDAIGNSVLVGAPVGLVVNSSVLGTITHASRKVFFGLVNNDSASDLTADGWKLFDATVEWLLPPVLTGTKGPGAGQLTLSWTGDGTLVTATNVAAPAWIAAPSQTNPQIVLTTETQRYYRVRQ